MSKFLEELLEEGFGETAGEKSVPEESLITCEMCEAEIPESSKECPKCGATLVFKDVDVSRKCPICFEELTDEAEICYKCGTPIEASSNEKGPEEDHTVKVPAVGLEDDDPATGNPGPAHGNPGPEPAQDVVAVDTEANLELDSHPSEDDPLDGPQTVGQSPESVESPGDEAPLSEAPMAKKDIKAAQKEAKKLWKLLKKGKISQDEFDTKMVEFGLKSNAEPNTEASAPGGMTGVASDGEAPESGPVLEESNPGPVVEDHDISTEARADATSDIGPIEPELDGPGPLDEPLTVQGEAAVDAGATDQEAESLSEQKAELDAREKALMARESSISVKEAGLSEHKAELDKLEAELMAVSSAIEESQGDKEIIKLQSNILGALMRKNTPLVLEVVKELNISIDEIKRLLG